MIQDAHMYRLRVSKACVRRAGRINFRSIGK